MKVEELMTRDFVRIQADRTVLDAARAMRESNVGLLPVFEGDALLGTVTDRDLVLRTLAEGADAASTSVKDVTTMGPITCPAGMTVEDAARIMHERWVRRIIVVDGFDRPIGVVSAGDLAEAFRQGALSGKALSEAVRSSLDAPRRKAL